MKPDRVPKKSAAAVVVATIAAMRIHNAAVLPSPLIIREKVTRNGKRATIASYAVFVVFHDIKETSAQLDRLHVDAAIRKDIGLRFAVRKQ